MKENIEPKEYKDIENVGHYSVDVNNYFDWSSCECNSII